MNLGNMFCSTSARKCNFRRFFSRELNKLSQNKINLANKFKYKEFFQEHFVETAGLTRDNRQNGHFAGKIRKPAELSYRGEILFGIHPVYLALKQRKRQFFQLFLKNEFTMVKNCSKSDLKLKIEYLARENGVDIRRISTRDLNCLAPNSVHQGVCLDASVLPVLFSDGTDCNLNTEFSSPPLWLILDSIQDPMNFGAVIRSSYFFGVDRLLTVRSNSCRLSPTVSKASSGAMEVMDIHSINCLKDFVERMKSNGWLIVSTAAYDDKTAISDSNSGSKLVELSQFSMRKPTILILGNEAMGVSSEVQSLCDVMLSIYPHKDVLSCIDSLNVSVATGIILHHMKSSCGHV